ncbi:MAG: MmgE/PrpD family protein [Burkholderiales bacterium]|mgnify:CR=1 FL=1|nr:MmgE/PrpD family protein [Burkholderiales bacterium]
MTLTEGLAGFIAGLRHETLPAGALDVVRQGLVDCVGVMFAGRDEEVVQIVLRQVRLDDLAGHATRVDYAACDDGAGGTGHTGRSASGLATVLGGRGRACTGDAAMVNAVAAHVLDYDDTGLDGHPSVVLVPALLALAESRGASGAALGAAYVAGYETWAELIGRDGDKHHGKGWHPTAVFGTVAAAAAAANLLQLDRARCAHALGIAASMAGGVVANFGSMTKSLQVGLAARNGLFAAQLAADGLSAAGDALEHKAGLLHAVSPAGRVRLQGPSCAGAPWQILRQGLNVKRYPICYAMHRAVDAALQLHPAVQSRLARIARIEVAIGHLQAGMLRSARPATVLDAKFSVQFGVAAGLLGGRVGLGEMNEAFVSSEPVQALLRKVQVTTTSERDAEDPLFSPCDSVRVVFDDGSSLDSEPVQRARGHAHNPLAPHELADKFRDCVTPVLGQPACEALLAGLSGFERIDKLSWAALAGVNVGD